jgi:tRNA threonylcarbamoyladenosine biosynthesis protein TsaE
MKTNHLSEFDRAAQECTHALKPRADEATVVALHGDLGAGKTTFVQAAARALGVSEPVTSPTFVIQKTYALHAQKFSTLVHIDTFRLESPQELLALGWADTIADPGNVIYMEWAEKVADILPRSSAHVTITFVDESTRDIALRNV